MLEVFCCCKDSLPHAGDGVNRGWGKLSLQQQNTSNSEPETEKIRTRFEDTISITVVLYLMEVAEVNLVTNFKRQLSGPDPSLPFLP